MENFPYDKHNLELSQLSDNHLVIGTSSNRTQLPDSTSLVFKFLHGGRASPSPVTGGGGVEMRCSPVYKVPVKLEKEDVFVMDEVFVGRGGGRKGLRASNSSRSLSSLGSGGSSSNSSPLGLENVCKVELCRAWEELGSCRLGSYCQFAHGKEELCPTQLSAKKKPEALMCKSFKSTGSIANVPNCQFLHPPSGLILASAEAASPAKPQIVSTAKLECTLNTPVPVITNYKEWSPLDDGIEVTLPSSSDKAPSREDIGAYIHDTVYGSISTTRKRLPVFLEICPD